MNNNVATLGTEAPARHNCQCCGSDRIWYLEAHQTRRKRMVRFVISCRDCRLESTVYELAENYDLSNSKK